MGSTQHDDSQFEQVDESRNVSQLVRSNAVHYWSNIKNEVDLGSLKPYLSFQGTLAGDPHMGNFSVLPLKKIGGVRQMTFANIDFDDAGVGPFVLDYIRYEIAAKAANKRVKKRALQKAYLHGLSSQPMEPPPRVQDLLNMSVAQYDCLAANYTEEHTTSQGFKLKPGEIEPYESKIARPTIEKLFPGEALVDLAIRPRARGGSADELRIWVLVEDKQSRRRIMELKQYGKPALERYQPQPPVGQWLAKVRAAFWPELDGSAYDLLDIRSAGLFWIREKHVSLIDVPYGSKKTSQVDFLVELANYDAYQLGLAHGRQAQAAAYRKAIEKDPKAFRSATGPVEKAYLKIAEAAFHEG